MKANDFVLWICAGILLTGCAPNRTIGLSGECQHRPKEVYGSTADSMLGGVVIAGAGGHADTERQIQPSAEMRTYDHMHALRYELRSFRARFNRLPGTIEEFSPHSAPGLKINVDGWGNSIRYNVFGDSAYEFRAPGPDHTLCTPDDMVARNDSLPSVPNQSVRS